MTTTYDPELSDIVEMANDMEAVENLIGRKGRFVGDMVHISISDLAEISRTKLSSPEITLNQWQDISTAPKEVLFVCRRKDKPWVQFEALLFDERESWEIPKIYTVLQNMTTDEPLDGCYEDYEWQPLPTNTEN